MCNAGVPGTVADDTETPGVDAPNDCVNPVCSGGAPGTAFDDTETPVDDGNPCTTQACDDGPQTTPVADGVLSDTSPSDCVDDQWCVNGVITPGVADLTEVPGDDGNECTGAGTCTAGGPEYADLPSGTPCDQGGGNVCNGEGACVAGCVDDTDCGTDTECRIWTCNGENQCESLDADDGELVDSGDLDDCVSLQCDGAGNIVERADDTELPPDDGIECTDDGVCSGGVAVYADLAAGEVCVDGVCDGAGLCVECIGDEECTGEETCVDNVCEAPVEPLTLYTQDFNALPSAVGNSMLAVFETALPDWAFAVSYTHLTLPTKRIV